MYSNWANTQTLMQWTVLGLLNRNMSLMAMVSDPPSLWIIIPFSYPAKEQKRKTKLKLPPTSVQHISSKNVEKHQNTLSCGLQKEGFLLSSWRMQQNFLNIPTPKVCDRNLYILKCNKHFSPVFGCI